MPLADTKLVVLQNAKVLIHELNGKLCSTMADVSWQ